MHLLLLKSFVFQLFSSSVNTLLLAHQILCCRKVFVHFSPKTITFCLTFFLFESKPKSLLWYEDVSLLDVNLIHTKRQSLKHQQNEKQEKMRRYSSGLFLSLHEWVQVSSKPKVIGMRIQVKECLLLLKIFWWTRWCDYGYFYV